MGLFFQTFERVNVATSAQSDPWARPVPKEPAIIIVIVIVVIWHRITEYVTSKLRGKGAPPAHLISGASESPPPWN
jgi:hypothetical protein